MFDKLDDSGVSPVIGVILMVAVTVALVALVTVTVFNLGGDVSDSPDATVQLEEDGGTVTATVLRNENVNDFTLQGTTDSGSTQTVNLGGDAGTTNTISGVSTTSSSTETFENDDGTNGNGDTAIEDTETVDLGNSDATSITSVGYDSNGDGTFGTDVTGDFSIAGSNDGRAQYSDSGTGPLDNADSTQPDIQIQYDYSTGTDSLSEVSVIANLPDGESEVLTSTEVNN